MRNVACHPRPVVTWSRSFGRLVRLLSVAPFFSVSLAFSVSLPIPLSSRFVSSRLVSSPLASLFHALALFLSSLKSLLSFSPFPQIVCLTLHRVNLHHMHIFVPRICLRIYSEMIKIVISRFPSLSHSFFLIFCHIILYIYFFYICKCTRGERQLLDNASLSVQDRNKRSFSRLSPFLFRRSYHLHSPRFSHRRTHTGRSLIRVRETNEPRAW